MGGVFWNRRHGYAIRVSVDWDWQRGIQLVKQRDTYPVENLDIFLRGHRL
jgi:hypothetical protein